MKSHRSAPLLVLVIVLQAAAIACLWGGGGAGSRAYAEIPDTAGARREMIEELKGINQRMDRLLAILESGNLQVKVAAPDDRRGK